MHILVLKTSTFSRHYMLIWEGGSGDVVTIINACHNLILLTRKKEKSFSKFNLIHLASK